VTDRSNVKSAQRVLDILQLFAERRRPATLADLSRELDLPKSSCLALLQTLQSNGFLYQFETDGSYYPTGKWLTSAHSIATHDPVVPRARPVLEKIHASSGETVCLAKRSHFNVVYLDVVESNQLLRYAAEAGQARPLHCSASGQALMAGMEAGERDALIARLSLEKVAAHTITSHAALSRKVIAGAARGWVSNIGEYRADTAGVAVPVPMNGNIYAVVVAAPSHRLEGVIERTAKMLIAACKPLADRIDPRVAATA